MSKAILVAFMDVNGKPPLHVICREILAYSCRYYVR
jgi:hypothetical protein